MLSCRRAIAQSFCRTLSVKNEHILLFKPGSNEREKLMRAIENVKSKTEEIPVVIGGKEYQTDKIKVQVSPYNHKMKIANVHLANKELLEKAVDNAMEAREKWDLTPVKDRVKVFMKASDRLATDLRPKILAACMVGQGKTIVQAEIDASCELIDFLRFNSKYAVDMDSVQPLNVDDANNQIIYRGLEGFVLAIAPFNFTAISGNLATAPAIMGNVVLWKAANTAVLSSWVAFQALRESGLPDGVIQFVPSEGKVIGEVATQSPHFAALNFTGSTWTFKDVWQKIAKNLDIYRTFPRIVGETGGKNFHLVHPTADLDSVVGGTIRAAFEYQGQKCSACSRMYVPRSKWEYVKKRLVEETSKVKMGPADDPEVFMTSVIDEPAFDSIAKYIDYANASDKYQCLTGGTYDKSVGYFIQPTIYEVSDPLEKLMREEIFGPVLTIYVYDDKDAEKIIDLVDSTAEYSLTGSIWSQDAAYTKLAQRKLRNTVGNMYLNDKCTGSVVAQQPFGGARMSGTNDKAGSPNYMGRWTSPLAVKTAIGDRKTWTYPSMQK